MTESSADCLFCKFVSGEIEAEVVHETETTLAFRDISPQAPTHVLVIPKVHQPTVADLVARHPEVVVDLLAAVSAVVDAEGLGDGHRLVFNTGPDALQSVLHVHGHVIGGRRMGWPPG